MAMDEETRNNYLNELFKELLEMGITRVNFKYFSASKNDYEPITFKYYVRISDACPEDGEIDCQTDAVGYTPMEALQQAVKQWKE